MSDHFFKPNKALVSLFAAKSKTERSVRNSETTTMETERRKRRRRKRRRPNPGEEREKKSVKGQKVRLWVPPCVFNYKNTIEL